MSDRPWGSPETTALVRFSGAPRNDSDPAERTRWQQFLGFFKPWANKGGEFVGRAHELADAYAESEVAIRQTQAQKYAAEAAEAAARTETLRQEKVKAVNDEIARIFTSDQLPDVAKQLQLATLLAANPDIAEQLNKIENIWTRLHLRHGTEIELSSSHEET